MASQHNGPMFNRTACILKASEGVCHPPNIHLLFPVHLRRLPTLLGGSLTPFCSGTTGTPSLKRLSWGENDAVCIRGRRSPNETQGWALLLSVWRRKNQILPKYRIIEKDYSLVILSHQNYQHLLTIGVKSVPQWKVISVVSAHEEERSLCARACAVCLLWWLIDSWSLPQGAI